METAVRKVYYGLVLVMLASAFPGLSQSGIDPAIRKKPEAVNGFFGAQVGIPLPEMQEAIRNNMGNLGFGFSFMVLSNPYTWGKNKRESPLRLGVEAGYNYYGRFLTDVTIEGHRGNIKTSYGILHLNGVLHLQPMEPTSVTPFAEILAGGNFYISSTRENLNAIESALNIRPIDFGGYSSASFNKGFALGLGLGSPREGNPRITLRASCNWGSDIRYVVRNSLYYDPSSNNLFYYVGEAPVRYILIQFGVLF